MNASRSDDATDEESVWQAERSLLHPEVRGDAAKLERLLDAGFHEIGQSGAHWTREEVIAALASEHTEHEQPIFSERRTHRLAPGLILITYRLEAAGRSSRRSSLWRLGEDGPVLLFHQGTPVDP